MRSRGVGAYLVALALLVGLGACSDPPPTAPDINITNITNNTNNNGQPGPTASPTPAAGVLSQVTVTQFGENCPSGSGPATWQHGGPPFVHVGCTAAITCNPLDKDKNHVPNPPEPQLFGLIGGDATVTVTPGGSNVAFNRDVKATKAGTAIFACTVSGIGSGPWSLAVIP